MLRANRTAREQDAPAGPGPRTHEPARTPSPRPKTAHDCTEQATTANDDRTNRNRSAGSAATPRERLQCRDRQTAHARRTKSAAAEHATHQPDQRAQVQVNETDAHRSRHARPIVGRRTSLVAQRPAPNRRYASPARSRKARRAARDSRVFDVPHRGIARAAMQTGSLIRAAARSQRVGTTIDAATATSHRRARIADLQRSLAHEPDRKAAPG